MPEPQVVYACVDKLHILQVPADTYPLISSPSQLHDGDISIDLEGIPRGTYRKVDGKYLGWMEWKVFQAKRKGISEEKIANVERFIKLLKQMTGFKAEPVDYKYPPPRGQFSHWSQGE